MYSEAATLTTRLVLDDGLTPALASAEDATQQYIATTAAIGPTYADAEAAVSGFGDAVRLKMAEANDAVGNFGDTVKTGVTNALDEAVSTSTAAGQSLVSGLGGAVNSVGSFFESNRSKIREFGRAGSELSIVMSFLGNDFKDLLGPVGEFIHIAGDAGLVLGTIADLGPAAASGIAGLLGLTTAEADHAAAAAADAAASRGAAVAFGAEAVAAGTASTALGADGLAAAAGAAAAGISFTAGAIAALAAAVIALPAGVILLGSAIGTAATASQDAEKATEQYNEKLNLLDGELASGQITIAQYNAQLSQIGVALGATTRDTDKLGNSAAGATRDMDKLNTSGGEVTSNFRDFNGVVDATTQQLGPATDAIAQFGNAAYLTGNQVKTAGNQADIAAGQFSNAAAAAAAFNRNKNIATGGVGPGAEGPGVDPSQTGPGLSLSDYYTLTHPTTPPPKPTSGSGGVGSGLTQAQKDAQALAAVFKTDVTNAFNLAKTTGDAFLDGQHTLALRAINDTLNLAKTQHDSAIQQIDDALNVRLAANAAPVTAAQAALSARQNQEQERNLQEAVGTAQAQLQANPNDVGAQRALRDALESLQNFRDGLNIANLQAKQAVADAQAHATAQKATAAADATYATAQATARAAITKADNDYAKNRKTFDDKLAIVEANILKHGGSIGTAFGDLDKALQNLLHGQSPIRFASIGQSGNQNVTVNVHVPAITLNGRAVSSALAASGSATQSSTVRQGQSRPVNVTIS